MQSKQQLSKLLNSILKRKLFSRMKILILFSIVIITNSCTKNDVQKQVPRLTDKEATHLFFKGSNLNSNVQGVTKDLQKLNEQTGFIKNFVYKNGIPVWQHILLRTATQGLTTEDFESKQTLSSDANQNKGVLFIPLQEIGGTRIKSYIVANKHNDTTYTYSLYNRDSLQNLQPKTKSDKGNLITALSMFGIFEKKINLLDSIELTGGITGVIKNAKEVHNNNPQQQNSKQTNSTEKTTLSTCITHIREEISYTYYGVLDGGAYREVAVPNLTITISISCGGTQYGSNNTGGSFVTGGTNWWDSGTGFGQTVGGSTNYSTTNELGLNAWWSGITGMPISLVLPFSPQLVGLVNLLSLTEHQVDFLFNDPVSTNELHALIMEDGQGDEVKAAARLAIVTMMNNDFVDADIVNEVGNAQGQTITDPIVIQMLIQYFTVKHAVLKHENSQLPASQQKSNIKLLYLTFSDAMHVALDLLGLIPVGGEVFDVINGFTYHLEGDRTNAYLSYASAVPFAGYAATTVKAIKAGHVIIAVIGKSGKFVAPRVLPHVFRKACGAVGSQVGHHIITFHTRVQEHDIMQLAFKAGFNPNDAAVNGKAIEGALNSGNHTAYANKIVAELNKIATDFPNLTPPQAKQKVIELIDKIKAAIDANPGIHVDNLPF